MMNVEISELARSDISNILTYTQQHYGDEQRLAYSTLIVNAIETIVEYPEIGHTRLDVPPLYRAFNIGKHVVVYCKKGQTIFIARIVHGYVDFTKEIE